MYIHFEIRTLHNSRFIVYNIPLIKLDTKYTSQDFKCTNIIVFSKFTSISWWRPESSTAKTPKLLVFAKPKAIQNMILDLSFTWVEVDVKKQVLLGSKFLKSQSIHIPFYDLRNNNYLHYFTGKLREFYFTEGSQDQFCLVEVK